MIKRVAEISKINYTLSGNPIIPDIQRQQENGEYFNRSLPMSFQYNGAWIVSHQCTLCNSLVNFQNLPNQNFQHINRLFSKFYKIEFLKALAHILPSTKVIKSSNSEYHFLTSAEFEGNIVSDLFIPQKTFAYYTCTECQSEYLCKIRQGYPIEAHRGNPVGKLGTIWIDEIIQIEMEDEKMRFSDALIKFRKTH